MKHVELYFDYASPWAYLASATLPKKLAGVEILWHPIYLRGIESFAKGVPYGDAKLAYLLADFQRCAAHERVALAPPATFPIDGLSALRAAHVALEAGTFDRFHPAMFSATWAEQRDVSNKDVVAAILAEAIGTTSEAALHRMSAQPIKGKLRDVTAKAVERGVFGVPTFFVGEEMFWGHDRIDYVARAAST